MTISFPDWRWINSLLHQFRQLPAYHHTVLLVSHAEPLFIGTENGHFNFSCPDEFIDQARKENTQLSGWMNFLPET